ncbi:hypothetical protein [Brevibacillus parabrevis]|uniref:Uncharacterized protein n=1 Tax=Brevibacillus parabrevis TaxID=54914 RepID=A0A4Y3PKJ6_BREPA|nr:hypothetical protein [Brevibacillus parabrevis]MBU8713867.1 hypothetical protein [Brevibacillus parabrevis]RNB94792.1 hypothetical protein EDM60_12965 [Brevibacillus parabrevis]GEB32496.1 hypothetical protein BPA01_20760 [Brevibacillus parabrevis]
MKRKAIVSLLVVAGIAGALGSFALAGEKATPSKPQKFVAAESTRPAELNEKLQKSWEVSINKFDIDTDQYTAYDYFDRKVILEQLPAEERMSYSDAILQAVNSVRKEGDLMPMLLVKDDLSETIIVFQRNDGTGTSVELVLKEQDSNKNKSLRSESEQQRSWALTSVEEK